MGRAAMTLVLVPLLAALLALLHPSNAAEAVAAALMLVLKAAEPAATECCQVLAAGVQG